MKFFYEIKLLSSIDYIFICNLICPSFFIIIWRLNKEDINWITRLDFARQILSGQHHPMIGKDQNTPSLSSNVQKHPYIVWPSRKLPPRSREWENLCIIVGSFSRMIWEQCTPVIYKGYFGHLNVQGGWWYVAVAVLVFYGL